MSTSPVSTNGCYIVTTDGIRLSIKRSVMQAIKRMIEEKKSGSVTIHFRDGGVSGCEDRTVYQSS